LWAVRKDFATVYAKLARADKHLDELRDMLAAHMSRPDVVTGTAAHGPDRQCHFRCQGLPHEVHAVIGDVTHNLRSALDHTANLLVRANGGKPQDGPGGTQFPMLMDRPGKSLRVRATRGGVSGEARDLIEAAQPYSDTWLGDQLAILNHVSNVDKHREAARGRHGPRLGYSWSGTGDTTAEWEAPIKTEDPEVDRVALVLASVPPVLGDGGWRGSYEVELELSDDDQWGPLHGTLKQVAWEVRSLVDRLADTVPDTIEATMRQVERSEDELALAASGIGYRLTQMTLALEALVLDAPAPVNPKAVRNALIESVLTQVRVLAYFVSKPRQEREVTAYDYLNEDEWDHRTPRAEVGPLIGLVSDHHAHAKHITPPEPWELLDMVRKILTHMTTFEQTLRARDSRQADWFIHSLAPLPAKLDHLDELAAAEEGGGDIADTGAATTSETIIRSTTS
jgi:hypothetical protein